MRQGELSFWRLSPTKSHIFLVGYILQEHPDKQNTPFIYFTKDTLIIIL